MHFAFFDFTSQNSLAYTYNVAVSEFSLMIFNKRTKASLVILFLILLLVAGYLIYKRSSCSKLECLSMQGLDEFNIQEVYRDDEDIYRALLSRDDDLLRVDLRSNISEVEGKSRIQAEITRMKALFENAASPYPGEISDEIACGEKYKPVFFEEEINGIQVSYFTGFLNKRLVFGACTDDQADYQGILALFYCPNLSQLYQLEIIAPNEKFSKSPEVYKQMLESISCREQ